MLSHTPRKPHSIPTQAPQDPEPTHLPVDPDEGPVPAVIPPDPESERIGDPETDHARSTTILGAKRRGAHCSADTAT